MAKKSTMAYGIVCPGDGGSLCIAAAVNQAAVRFIVDSRRHAQGDLKANQIVEFDTAAKKSVPSRKGETCFVDIVRPITDKQEIVNAISRLMQLGSQHHVERILTQVKLERDGKLIIAKLSVLVEIRQGGLYAFYKDTADIRFHPASSTRTRIVRVVEEDAGRIGDTPLTLTDYLLENASLQPSRVLKLPKLKWVITSGMTADIKKHAQQETEELVAA